MKDLPYLRTDAQGNSAGPHVIMLSGSSWAEGSYEYHINRPVNYILEADGEKRAFLEKTRFFESGFPERQTINVCCSFGLQPKGQSI